ncbi:MAG TPA: hypothetical protein VLR27_10930 [Acidimicrobiales bacterium]|nr:hypothetical protein [Acidimicrobiales bacterium]
MTTIIIGLLIVVLGTVAYIALRNAQDFSDANEVIPGVATSAPKEWAGAHSVEARLHRRLRDSMTALRANRSLDEPAMIQVREALEREALAIDEQLVAAAALPQRVRDEPLRQVATAVESVEATVADVVLLRGPERASTEAAIEQVRTRLALVAEARAELDALSGPSAVEQLRRELDLTAPAPPEQQPTTEPPPATEPPDEAPPA